MEDFPSKVATETSAAQAQPQGGGNSLRGLAADAASRVDMAFLKSIRAWLMLAEMIMGLLQWALIASSYYATSAYGWVMFVAVTLWLLTTILFFILLTGVHQKLPFVPWDLTRMVYNAVATLLYLTAFLANALNINSVYASYGHLAAAAFFAAVVTIVYGVSTFLAYLDWKASGNVAAANTAPPS